MGLGKSFGISFLIYIVLNFAMNLLMVVATGAVDIGTWFQGISYAPMLWLAQTLFCLGSLNIAPFEILSGISGGIGYFSVDIFPAIMMLIAYAIRNVSTPIL